MLTPTDFPQYFVAFRNTPYLCGHPDDGDHTQGGVLRQGQEVWTNFTKVPDRTIKEDVAFVEGVGVVSLNPHWLIPAHLVARHGGETVDGEN